jgi:hypothetical protein
MLGETGRTMEKEGRRKRAGEAGERGQEGANRTKREKGREKRRGQVGRQVAVDSPPAPLGVGLGARTGQARSAEESRVGIVLLIKTAWVF